MKILCRADTEHDVQYVTLADAEREIEAWREKAKDLAKEFLAQGREMDESKTRLVAKVREWMHALPRAPQWDWMREEMANAIGDPAPDIPATVNQMADLRGIFGDEIRRELRGKNLACYCKPGTPCHADVLLDQRTPQRRHRRTPARNIMNKSQDPEAAETVQTTSVPAVALSRLVLGSSEYPEGIEETWRADAGWQRADAAEAKLATIHEKAESALQTSWLHSGKEHVEKLMREIATISSENVQAMASADTQTPPKETTL